MKEFLSLHWDRLITSITDAYLDFQGKYILNDQTTTNMMSKGAVYHVNGTSQYIEVADNANYEPTTNDFGVRIKFRPNNITDANKRLISKTDGSTGFEIVINEDDLKVSILDGVADVALTNLATGIFSAGKWSDISVMFDRDGNIQAYENGLPVGTAIACTATATIANASVMRFATETGGTTNEAHGHLAYVDMWNKLLSASEVLAQLSEDIPFKWQYGSQTSLWDAAAAVFTSGTYAWTAYGANTIANVSNTLEITYVGDARGAFVELRDSDDLSSDLEIGQAYRLTVDAKYTGGAAGVRLNVYSGASTESYTDALTTGLVTYTVDFIAESATSANLKTNLLAASNVVTIDNLSLVPLGAVALFSQDSMSPTHWGDKANSNDGAITGCELLNQADAQSALSIVLTPVGQDATPKEGQMIYNSATNKLNVWTGAAWEVVTSA